MIIRYSVRNIMETRFNLTQEQNNIINSKYEIKKIIACAGSGKTSVLTRNIIKILDENYCKPEEILALTFTNNAAENMREKIKKSPGNYINADDLDIYTFNSFGNLIIKENSFNLGFGKNFKLINEVQAWQIIYDIFKDYKFKKLKAGRDIGKFVKDLLDYIWNLKNNLITSEALKDYLENNKKYLADYKSPGLLKEEEEKIPYIYEFCDIYKNYESIKRIKNYIDYSDQIFLPYFLLKEHPAVKEKYSCRYKYIFVDEFQDTNNAQAYLLSMLFAKGKNKLMVVGDDDQGIYGFRGACIENIQDFSYFPEDINKLVKTFFLTINFRSGKKIIDFTNSIIRENKKRETKVVKPENEEKKSSIIFFKTNSSTQEAEQISELVLELNSKGYKLRDMAVLCRKKRFSDIIKSFKKNNIRYEVIGSKSYFYEPEILFLISWLKVIHNITDDESVVYLMKSSKFKISDRDIYFLKKADDKINEPAYFDTEEIFCKSAAKNIKNNNPEINTGFKLFSKKNALIYAVKNSDSNKYLGDETKKRLALFLEELNYYIKNSEILSLNGIISLIFHFSGLYDELNSRFGVLAKKKIINIENLIKLAWEFEENNFSVSFDSFVIYLKDIAKTDYEDPDFQIISKENSVKLMSIHAAKGLEFKAVFLPMLWESYYKPRRAQKKFYELPSPLRKDGRIWKEKGNHTSIKNFEEELKSSMLEEEKRIFYVAGSRAKELLVLSYPQYENQSDIFKDDANIRSILPFISSIFEKNSSTVFLGEETLNYVSNTFDLKPQFYSNDFGTIFNDLFNAADKKAQKNQEIKKEDAGRGVRSKRINEDALSSSYEKILAENINKISGDAKVLSFSELWNLNEKNMESNLTRNNFFSLTEILTFLECPFLYKLRYVINMPEAENNIAGYGIKMHKFIENITSFYFKDYLNNKLKNNTSINKKYYDLSCLDFNKGKPEDLKFINYINNFYKSGLLSFELIQNILTEQLFYWKINGFYLTCKIDRIDILKNGLIRLYDYKTSSYEKNAENSNYIYQIKSYISGLSDLFGIPVGNISGSLIYLEDGKDMPVNIIKSEKLEIEGAVIKAINDITKKKYPKPDFESCGRFCNFKSFCLEKHRFSQSV